MHNIEEFMILANVRAEVLTEKVTLLFRVHEEPSDDKLESLRETAKSAGLVLAKDSSSHETPEHVVAASARHRAFRVD